MKICFKCKVKKPLDQFWLEHRKSGSRKPSCISCMKIYNAKYREKNREKIRESDKKRYWDNIFYQRERHLIRKYGVSLSDYNKMFYKQKGKCAICSKKQSRSLDVDHDHETKKVRGLLCTNCNRMIGHAHDSPKRLLLAANYLKSSRK